MKTLVIDVETAPILAYTWTLFDERLGVNQIHKDWAIIAFSAKWYDEADSKIIYMDNRNKKNPYDDKALLKEISKLINKSDIVLSQNGKKFDRKKINARAVINGLPPIKPVPNLDVYTESKKVFSFTSHGLAYVSDTLNKKHRKLAHKEFPGFALWKEVLNGNKKAWKEMETYCKEDVLATEEYYNVIQSWIKSENKAASYDDLVMRCICGSTKLKPRGYARNDRGKFRIYHCTECGRWPRSKKNLLSVDKRKKLLLY